jgi:hypothetical protein
VLESEVAALNAALQIVRFTCPRDYADGKSPPLQTYLYLNFRGSRRSLLLRHRRVGSNIRHQEQNLCVREIPVGARVPLELPRTSKPYATI